QKMKESPRGPFKHLRWFCNDGTVLPPKEYACREHGGGVQHGEWTDRVKTMRNNGYYIANVYADIKPEFFIQDPDYLEILKQMILEQFLINTDDGWIMRRARYYRGSLQAEDETRGGRSLLLELLKDPHMRQVQFTLLRQAARYLPHGRSGAPISEMRQLSLTLAERDKNFETLRIKIHVRPELSDAQQVREYAAKRGQAELLSEYEQLAATIEAVYQPRDIKPEIIFLAKKIKKSALRNRITKDAGLLTADRDAVERFEVACRMLAAIRNALNQKGSPNHMLALMDISLLLEGDLFRTGNQLLEGLDRATRRQRLDMLSYSIEGLYGIGLMSARHLKALQQDFAALAKSSPQLIDYKTDLEYAARVPEWADRTIRFNFSGTVAHLAVIEPLIRRFIHDALRGSLLLTYSAILETLLADADQQLGIYNDLFGRKMATGLRGLNAGLARGVLKFAGPDGHTRAFDAKAIYVLPSTTEELPPVAGIITAGKGNILSHVQLLARNLGIPNVAVEKRLLDQISSRRGQRVVLAVSPRGIVQLVEDGPGWNEVFAVKAREKDILIRPDLNKLNLYNHSFIPLDKLRASDSGSVAGPKAANLAELKHHFPEAVTDGLVIPFGLFRALLDQQIEPGGPPAFIWMQEQYDRIASLEGNPPQQDQIVRQFLQRLRDWIIKANPGDDFRDRLRMAMTEVFGPDGTYGVFVRSDTNVEDLPGFTGAGLNLTVPNVVGFDNVMAAISRVWASPFTERAYRWRQSYMATPEHVYASVLLLKSVPADKSGVMITADIDTGQPGWLTIAVNEGVGGAVSGQTAEELKVNLENGRVRLMAHAAEPQKRVLLPQGGMIKIEASGTEAVLNRREINLLIQFAESVPDRFPRFKDTAGHPVPADIEFGFFQNKLVLFQIRPFLESSQARQSLYLNRLDQNLKKKQNLKIDWNGIPAEENQ
ncbi:MAG: PEP/pyruvate-binding domain-containing protein, partial [Desulfobacterales bacterium]